MIPSSIQNNLLRSTKITWIKLFYVRINNSKTSFHIISLIDIKKNHKYFVVLKIGVQLVLYLVITKINQLLKKCFLE